MLTTEELTTLRRLAAKAGIQRLHIAEGKRPYWMSRSDMKKITERLAQEGACVCSLGPKGLRVWAVESYLKMQQVAKHARTFVGKNGRKPHGDA